MNWLRRLLRWFRQQTLASGCCDGHPEVVFRQGTPEFEKFVAEAELSDGKNLKHGMLHLSNLISFDPYRTDWCQLLAGYYDAAQGDLSVLMDDVDGERYYTIEAARAWFLNHEGKTAEALVHLNSVVHAKPDSTYMEAWGLDWAESGHVWGSMTSNDQLMILANRYSEHRESPERMRRSAERFAILAEQVETDELRPMLNMSQAGFYRKAGLFKKGLAFVQESRRAEADNWHTAVAEGLMLRQMDECELAEVAFGDALRFDPDDRAARLEAADMYFERQNWQPALEWYQSVLDLEPDHIWAYPSSLWCRWKLESNSAFPDDHFPDEFGDLLSAGNDRARQLTGFFHPFLGSLPQPVDATANLLRQLTDAIVEDPENGPTGEIEMTLSALEAPSNFLAFDLEMAALKSDCSLKIEVENVSKRNDPRVPVESVQWLLWRYEGTDAIRNLPEPSAEIRKMVDELAWRPYDFSVGWAHASRLATHVRVEQIPQLLSAMIYPSPVPDGWSALEWLPRVQHAAAWILAHVEDDNDGPDRWSQSSRREALMSLLLGPMDWTTEAAIVALAQLACENESISQDVNEAFAKLSKSMPDGHVCYEFALFFNWSRLPNLFDHERENIRKHLDAME